ncbi:MAG: CheB methylesterase domain-containing protein, partial [Treponema sp.]|nr:CheB methylesterase domain-containing protein [Treponema sp.]
LATLKRVVGSRKSPDDRAESRPPVEVPRRTVRAVVIGASTGGPGALYRLCGALPANFPIPIILVQHNSTGFDHLFAQWLDECAPFRVSLAREREIPEARRLYIAPTDIHLAIDEKGFRFDDGELIRNQKPAVDALFASAAALYGDALVSVVLTGMGNDGADGTRRVKEAGGITIAQDEASSVVYGMPRAAWETGCVDLALHPEGIAARLVKIAGWGADARGNYEKRLERQ